MRRAAIVSFRLRMTDGVSVVAAGWERALRRIGFDVVTVAGEGPVDRLVPGLAIDAPEPPERHEVEEALAAADLVVVANLCTIPRNLAASRVVAAVLAGRPAILHHHDPPWQRAEHLHVRELPADDAAWRHVALNELTRRQLATRGIEAEVVPNGFPPSLGGDRAGTRAALGIDDGERLVLHPVRAIARKNIPAAIAVTEAIGGIYWLTGQAEDGYDAELARLLRAARCPVLHAPPPAGRSIHDAYAACDVVVFPSTWEGFGNPAIEAALHRKPAVVGRYPVADELRRLGFRWFDPDDPASLERLLMNPERLRKVCDHNQAIARASFSEEQVVELLAGIVGSLGLLPIRWQPVRATWSSATTATPSAGEPLSSSPA